MVSGLLWAWCFSTASAWPLEQAWLPLEQGGAVLEDALDDASAPAVDLAGDATQAAVSWSVDLEALYFRLRLAGAPAPGPAFGMGLWGVAWDVDGDDSVDFVTSVQDVSGSVYLYQAQGEPTLAEGGVFDQVRLLGSADTDDARIEEADAGYVWVSFSVPLGVLASDLGLSSTDALRWVAVTRDQTSPGAWSDVLGCGEVASCPEFSTLASDAVVVDEDSDLLTLPLERLAGTDPADADTDDDGLLDGEDPGPLTCDTDQDGVLDSVEAGLAVPGPGTAEDGCFVADLGEGTTDPADADSDDGGMSDGQEDRNGNGVLDPYETDPTDPSDDLDSDGDGFADVVEGLGDYDGDGIPNLLDTDSDQDGLADSVEGVDDVDEDGQPAFLDEDADNDGFSDGAEGTSDPDRDGLPAYLDLDADGDGLLDAVEGLDDFDGDDTPNFLDRDSDNDGRLDEVEGAEDEDCDGEPDFLDVGNDDGFCDTDLPVGLVDTSPFDGESSSVEPAAKVTYTGGACSMLPAGRFVMMLVGLGLLSVRRRTAPLAVLVVAALPVTAEATSLDADRFRPTVDSWRFVWVEDAAMARPAQFGTSVIVEHGRDLLVMRSGEQRIGLLSTATTAHVMGHATPSWRLRLGLAVPVHMGLSGQGWSVPAALGDIRFSAKIGLMRSQASLPLDVSVVADLELPTGAGWAYVGSKSAVAQLGVALRADPVDRLALAAELGVRSGTGARLGDYVIGPELAYGVGASVEVNPRLWIGAEIDGAWSFMNGGVPGATPLELIGTARGHLGRHVQVTAGAGTGLTAGIGAPAWRVLVGIAWLPGYAEAGIQSADESASTEQVPLGRVLFRVVGPDGQPIQGATVAVENTPVQGETDQMGLFEHSLEPGEHLVRVEFGGRASVNRTFEVVQDGLADLTVVMFDADESAPTRDQPAAPTVE